MIPDIRVLDEDARRSVLVDLETREPFLIAACVIPSESTPGRIRVAFSVKVPGRDGTESAALVSSPFRIESN